MFVDNWQCRSWLRASDHVRVPKPTLQFRSCLDRASSHRSCADQAPRSISLAAMRKRSPTAPFFLRVSTTIAISDSPASAPGLISILWQCSRRWGHVCSESLCRNFEAVLYQYRVRNELAGLSWQNGASRFGQGVKESTGPPASHIRAQMPDRVDEKFVIVLFGISGLDACVLYGGEADRKNAHDTSVDPCPCSGRSLCDERTSDSPNA